MVANLNGAPMESVLETKHSELALHACTLWCRQFECRPLIIIVHGRQMRWRHLCKHNFLCSPPFAYKFIHSFNNSSTPTFSLLHLHFSLLLLQFHLQQNLPFSSTPTPQQYVFTHNGRSTQRNSCKHRDIRKFFLILLFYVSSPPTPFYFEIPT